jgi:hypothetical protein
MENLLVSCICPPEKEGNSKVPKAYALKISNFGIDFWQRKGDTSKTFERGYRGLFDMEISILGAKETLNSVADLTVSNFI